GHRWSFARRGGVGLPRRSTPFPYTTLFRSQGFVVTDLVVHRLLQAGQVGRGLGQRAGELLQRREAVELQRVERLVAGVVLALVADRKSTRLNSSHVKISYAVFCLKKKLLEG